MKKRILSMLLVIVMVVGMLPTTVFAAMGDNLCEHHTEHTAECGYVEGVRDCAYHCDVCLGHDHDGEESSESVCTCASDDPEWHAPFCALYVLPEVPACYCTEKCAPDMPNEWCDVCYFDADACAGSDEEQGAAYATTPTYIASLGIAQDAHEGDAKGELSGHTVIDYDLNKGCGSSSDYIYMGYKTTTDPGKAITGIFIRTGENPPASATFDGVTAYLVGGSYEANTAVDNVVDLNEDAGGAYIYVYVTRDTSRAPVTEIAFSSSGSKSGYTTPNVDLNQGVGGSDDIYLHYKQYSATAYINYYYLSDNFTVVHKQVSGTLKHHLDKMTATPSGTSDVIYNGKTAVRIGWREDPSVQNQGEALTTPSVTLETSGKNYYAAYRLGFRSTTSLTFDANGGSGAPSTLVRNDDTRYVTAGKSVFIIEKMAFTIPSTKPTHADKCQFLGWSTNKNATTAAYQPGQTIQVDLNTTLYAVYQQNHSFGSNGFCTKCDAGYQPAVLKNGYYQISNAGQLFWFANHVNTVDRAANAVLTADIDLENRQWTPIGSTGESSNNFRGHFDGDGHTIKGLYVEGNRAGLGFFGEVRTGTVENFTIYGEVNVIGSHDYVGGVIGSACGLNSNAPDHNGATIRNITSYVDLTAGAHGIGMVGGFIGYANHETLIENCAWYGTFDAGIYRVDSGAGGFVGRIYDTATVTIRNCAAYGTVKTAYQSGTFNNHADIYIGGFLSYSPSGAATTLENDLWAGQIINNTNLTAANAHLSAYGTMNSAASKTNCYALEGTPYVTTNDENDGGITTVTAEQLKSGEIAYKLGSAWGQNIGEDAYPVLGGAKVYENTDCAGVISYSNIKIEGATHDFDENGFCTNCGGYQPAELVDGYYEISNAGQLYWFAAQVNGGNTGINGKLMENITVNANVLDANGELNSGSENFRAWTPIGKSGNYYTGTFDGNGKTVSGLYFNDGEASRVGLFGYIYSGTVQNVGVMDSYLSGFAYIGGIAGGMEGGGTITGCTNSATVSGAGHHVGGIVGYACGSSTIENSIKNCRNSGGITGNNNVGGIVGLLKYTTAENCYNTGTVSSLGVVGGIRGFNGLSGVVNNSYYLDTCGAAGSGTVKTTAQFASGEVAYLLGDAFGQTIGEEEYPVLGGAKVYSVTCGGNPIYSNSDESYTEHTNVGGFCAVCGVMLCDHSGNENQHTDCTVDFVCSVCGVVITEAAAGHTYGEDDGDCTTAVLCSVCGTAVVAAKAHAFDSNSTCTNDGCTAIGYMLWVGGEQFTSKKLTITDENGGTATYDPENNILTLDNYTYEGAGYTWNEPYGDGYFMQFSAAICYGGTASIRLVLNGESTVVHTGTSNGVKSCGIYTNGSIEILDGSADGISRLTAKGGPTMDDYSCGVYARGCSINVTSGSLTAIGGTAKYGNGYGMYAHNGSIEVTGGSLTGIGGEAYNSTGVWADKDIVISGSGMVVATGGDSNESSHGVATYGSIQVTGGSLTATRGKGMGDVSYGVYASGGLTMGTGYGIVTPVGGNFNGSTVVDADGNIAKEVVIAEKPAPDPVKVQLELTKEFNDWGRADGFTFNLAAVTENAPMPASPSAKATLDTPLACFGEITFTAAGIYEYTITEVNSGIPGVTYDTSAHEVVVTITENTEGNKLIAEVKYDGGLSLIITNTYTEVTPYDLWVGGAQVTSHNAADVFGDGKVSYNSETNTLTLNSYTYEGAGHTWEEAGWDGTPIYYGAGIYYSGNGTLELVLVNDSTVIHTDGTAEYSSGIYADNGSITISGSGSLTANGGSASGDSGCSYGVFAKGNINVSGGTVEATGSDEGYISYGVCTYGAVSVSDNGSLTGTGGTAEMNSYGVLAYEDITVTGGSLTGTGGTATGESSSSYGVYTNCNINVSGGSLSGTSGNAIDISRGVRAYGTVSVTNNGSLTGTGGTATGQHGDSYGVYVDDGITVIGSSLTGTGGTATGVLSESYGVYVSGGNINVSGGSLSGTSGNATIKSYGVFADGGLTMGEGIGILTPVGGSFDAEQKVIVDTDGNIAKTVVIAEKPVTPYDLWVGGAQFTSKNLTINGTTGTATYDPDSNTLTLDGYTYEGAGHTWEIDYGGGYSDKCGAAIYYGDTKPLNLILKGKNTIAHAGSGYGFSYGLFSEGDIVVSEDSAGGSLTVSGGAAMYNSYGVYTYETIKVESGSLSGIGGEAKTERSYGVYANKGITVNGGSLTGIGGDATGEYGSSFGVYANNNSIKISGDGILTGTGGEVKNYYSDGVFVDGLLEVSGGTLTGTGGASGYCSYGVNADDGIIVTGGSLTGIGGTAEAYDSVGVRTGYYSGITVSGGSLKATSGTAGEMSTAVYTSSLDMSEGVELLTPVDGSFDADQHIIVFGTDGNIAKEVRIAKSAPKVTLTAGKLTVTNTSVEAAETVDMIIMVAGYTGGKMNGCQEITEVTGVTEVDLAVTGDTIKVFFLNPDTYAPLFACAEP